MNDAQPMAADGQPYFYDLHVFCCTNRREPGHARGCCAEKNAEHLRDYLKTKSKGLKGLRLRINASGCLDRCELGPVLVMYPGGVWYHYRTEADLDEILEQHVQGGTIVERLQLGFKQRRLLPESDATAGEAP